MPYDENHKDRYVARAHTLLEACLITFISAARHLPNWTRPPGPWNILDSRVSLPGVPLFTRVEMVVLELSGFQSFGSSAIPFVSFNQVPLSLLKEKVSPQWVIVFLRLSISSELGRFLWVIQSSWQWSH